MHSRPLATVAVLLACALAVAGCNGDDPAPTTSSSSTSTPSPSVSGSPEPSPTKALTPAEQDLRSAGEAVTQYWRVIDEVASDPAVSLNVLATVARAQALEQWQTTLAEFRTKQWKQVGASTVRGLVPSTADGEFFTVTACVDVSDLDVVDGDGKSVVVVSRPAQQQFTYQVVKAAEGFFVTQDTLEGRPCAA